MAPVSSDILASPPAAEATAGRAGTAPVAGDAASFGEHLSRAAKPVRPDAKAEKKLPGAPGEIASAETPATLVEDANEGVVIAAACLVQLGCDQANTLELPLLDGVPAEAAADDEADHQPTAEELSLIVALQQAVPVETVVQVDTLTLGAEAEQLAAESPEAGAPVPAERAQKPDGKSATTSVAPQRALAAREVSSELSSRTTTPADPAAKGDIPVTNAAVATKPEPVVAAVEPVVAVAEPTVLAEIAATAEVAPVNENPEVAAKRARPVRAERVTKTSQTAESNERAEASPAATDGNAPANPQPGRQEVDRVTLPAESRDRPRSQSQAAGSPATVTPSQAAATAAVVEQLAASSAKPAANEVQSQRSSRPALEGVVATTPTAPSAKSAAIPTETAPAMPVRDTTTAPLIGSVLGRRAGVAASNGGEVDRVRFVQRVARAVQASVDRGGEVTLRLSPPELGAMRLEVTIRDGVMTAHIETETPAARSVLMDNLPTLRDRLAEQHVRIEKFEVDVRGSDTGALPDRTADQSNSSRQAQTGRGNRKRTDASTEIVGPTTTSPRSSRDGQLNVVV